MVQKYEVLLLTVPEITGDEAKGLENHLEKVIKSHKGSIISFDRWGKYKLAYEIQKSDYGVYYLVRFEVPKGTSAINDIKALFKVKLNTVVMRDMIAALNPKKPLTYQRPRSLEEAPSREVDSFLKENKMAGFMSDEKDVGEE